MEKTTGEINGLPAHVLLIHFVVIVVPLAALCALLAVAWPAARRRLGIVTPLIALAALVSVPLTTEAGEWLEERVAETPLSEAHVEIGESLLPWAIALFLLAAAHWAWFRYVSAPDSRFSRVVPGRQARRVITLVLAAAIGVAAVGSVVTVVLIGESGVRAVWSGNVSSGEN